MIYQKIEVTAEQRQNLIKLAQYLMLGEEDEDFSMSLFTVGVIDLPRATGAVPLEKGERPFDYIARVFGVQFKGSTNSGFRWMFSTNWIGVDNSPRGAAQRIVLFLTHGVPTQFAIAPLLTEKYSKETVALYDEIPFTWAEIIADFPDFQLPPE